MRCLKSKTGRRKVVTHQSQETATSLEGLDSLESLLSQDRPQTVAMNQMLQNLKTLTDRLEVLSTPTPEEVPKGQLHLSFEELRKVNAMLRFREDYDEDVDPELICFNLEANLKWGA